MLDAQAQMEQLERFYDDLWHKEKKGLSPSSSESSMSTGSQPDFSDIGLSGMATTFLSGGTSTLESGILKKPGARSEKWWEDSQYRNAENTDGPRLSMTDLMGQLHDPDWQNRLKQGAANVAEAGQKYKGLLSSLEDQVNTIKSELYQAQNVPGSGLGRDANQMLDQVLGALQNMQGDLAQSVALKQTLQNGARYQKRMIGALQENQDTVESILNRQVSSANESLESHKVTCRNLLNQIARTEDELHSLRGMKDGMHSGDEPAVEPIGVPDDGLENDTARIEASLEGTQQILHAFANVMKPHIVSILPKDSNEQTPAERVTFEFLRAFASVPTAAKLRGSQDTHQSRSEASPFGEEVSLQSQSPASGGLAAQRSPSNRRQQRPPISSRQNNPMKRGKPR